MHRTQRSGFILKDALVLMFSGTLCITFMLRLFSFSYKTEERINSYITERDDFLMVSERIKSDLNKKLLQFVSSDDSIVFTFFQNDDNNRYIPKTYSLYHTGYGLIYMTERMQELRLSSLCRDIEVEGRGNTVTVFFYYPQNVFWRTFGVNKDD